MDKQEQVEPKKVTSFVDFGKTLAETLPIIVNFRDDVIEIEARVLPVKEWMALDHAVSYPDKVQKGANAAGPVYDYNDLGYQQALRDRNDRVSLKRIAASLQGQMQGETNDEKADWLANTFPVGLLTSIYSALINIHQEGEATIIQRRDSFHSDGVGSVKSNGKAQPDA